jgi:hypothetical protein
MRKKSAHGPSEDVQFRGSSSNRRTSKMVVMVPSAPSHIWSGRSGPAGREQGDRDRCSLCGIGSYPNDRGNLNGRDGSDRGHDHDRRSLSGRGGSGHDHDHCSRNGSGHRSRSGRGTSDRGPSDQGCPSAQNGYCNGRDRSDRRRRGPSDRSGGADSSETRHETHKRPARFDSDCVRVWARRWV